MEDDVADPKILAVIYQKTPGPDGLRGVGFADGHATYVDAEEWEQCKNVSGIE